MKSKLSIKEMTLVGIFTAITAIMAQISIPLPFSPVPITLQVFAVCLSAVILGSKLGTISQIVYVLLGIAGAPVFANLTGGLHIVLGPTGGFIISFPLMAFIIGKFVEKDLSIKSTLVGLFLSLFICYFLGVMQLSFITKMGIQKAILFGAVPYIPLDIAKIITVSLIGVGIRIKLIKADLITC